MGRLDGKVAIITGASRGMGEAHVRCFATEGARVVVADVLEDEGEAVAGTCGAGAVYDPLDVTDAAAWRRVVNATMARWGRIDVLVNNAGIFHMTKCAAQELAPSGVRVHSVPPVIIDTPMAGEFDVHGIRADLDARIPIGREARPDEVSPTVLVLASDDSSYCTGGEYLVDGAVSA